MIRSLFITFGASLFILTTTVAQADRWQQSADYNIDVRLDVQSNIYTGHETITYTNNSPDLLKSVYIHLFMNAFQPNSMMDYKSRTVKDPDSRVADRIYQLTPEEQGYIHVTNMTRDGQKVSAVEEGTILEVSLNKPIQPGETTVFELDFEAQVPVQVRRNGRDSEEGISFSMSQWYPKMSNYDYQGWHANPYVGREFYGVWGDWTVNITLDNSYIVAGTGYLQNGNDIGYGYETKGASPKRKGKGEQTWQFKGSKLHDWVWAADPDYTQLTHRAADGTLLRFFYQDGNRTRDNWNKLPVAMDSALQYINKHFGQYPYQQYSFIQGGDGGMEYPMATLITGERNFGSLVGVSVHEMIHNWYQGLLGTNEFLYPWMDEGFTTYATEMTMNHLREIDILNEDPKEFPMQSSYDRYIQIAKAGYAEPLITPADFYVTNTAYWTGAYSKGGIFMQQLEYIIGKETMAKGLLDYFNTWKYKHPNPNDFIRIMEKESDLELDWYKEYWVQSNHNIDYKVEYVAAEKRKKTRVKLSKQLPHPMPLDVLVTFKDGTQKLFYIPLRIMRGEKKGDVLSMYETAILPDWPWVQPEYEFYIDEKFKKIDRVEIDPSLRMCDFDRENNIWTHK